jgi:DNA modification methylase
MILGACRIEHSDVRSLVVDDGSVDLVFSDPPYDKESLKEWEALGEFASKALKPGGYMIAYTGLMYLPDVLAAVTLHLPYCWSIAVIHSGNTWPLNYQRNVTNRCKLIVTFRKPPSASRRPNPDVLIGNGKEKDFHEWQQAVEEAETLISWFTEEGDLVCDPMCGSGTSAVASLRMGRRYIGCDRDPSAVSVAQDRAKAAVEVQPSPPCA